MPGLMGFLLDLDRDRLDGLAARWSLSGQDAGAAAIYAEMTDIWALAWALESLQPRTRLTLDAVASARRHSLYEDQLARDLPFSDENRAIAVAELAEWGMAQRVPGTRGQAIIVWEEIASSLAALARLAAASDPSSAPLRSLLASLPSAEVQRLAERWAISDADVRLRRELEGALAELLTNRDSARKAAANLGTVARRTLTLIVRGGGRLEVRDVVRRLGVEERTLRLAQRELEEMGFARASYAGGRRALYVPIGVGTLEAPDSGANEGTLTSVPGPPPGKPSYAAMWDLLTLLQAFRTHQLSTGKATLGESQVRRLAPLLRDQTSLPGPRLRFLAMLARGLDLLAEDDGRLIPGPRVSEWEELDFAQQSESAFKWWISSQRWREGLPQGERESGGPIDLVRGRERLLSVLAECETGQWYTINAFLESLKQREPLLFREREAMYDYGGAAALRVAAQYWDRWDGKLARGALELVLAWLGIIDVGDIAGLSCFALTPFGAWLLGKQGAVPPAFPSSPPLREGADGTVHVLWPDARAVSVLVRCARTAPGEEPSFVLERQRVVEAISYGMDPTALVDVLRRSGLGGSPLVELVRGWAGAVEQISVSQPTVLTGSPAALDRLIGSTKFAGLRLQRLGPRHASVGDEAEFRRALERLRSEGFVFYGAEAS